MIKNIYIKKLDSLFKKNKDFYNNQYSDLKVLNNNYNKLFSHTIKFGVNEERIIINNYDENILYYKYVNIINNYDKFKKIKWSLYNLVNYTKEDIFYDIIQNNDTNKYLKKNFRNNQKSIEINKDNEKINDYKIDTDKNDILNNIIKKLYIKQIYVSKSLEHFKNRFIKKYKLKEYKNKLNIALFFGLYNNNDYLKVLNHKGKKVILFAGSDLPNIKKIERMKNIYYIAISKNIHERLLSYNKKSLLINFNLLNKNIFKPVQNYGESIYIYDGFSKKDDNEKIYNTKLIDIIKEKLPQFNYIHSSDLQLNYEDMPEIYKKCFIGLRLTDNDGNANTVQEFEAMNIPIIHNFSNYGLPWNNSETIIDTILKTYEKNLKYIIFDINKINYLDKLKKNTKQINFHNNYYFNNELLKAVYDNINYFNSFIKDYKNILFISGDYPGYGGSSTDCYNISKYYSNNGHNTYNIFFNYDDSTNKKYFSNDKMIIVNQSDIINSFKFIPFIPDLIFLKTPVNIDLKKYFNCKILFSIGGIYKNTLDKFYNNLTSKEHYNYVNNSVIEQLKYSDIIFTNSSLTKDLLKKYHNTDCYLFYSNFINYYNKFIINNNNNERKYEYGLIVSNFNRPIKNINNIIKFLKNKKNVILIGENSDIYKKYGFTCIPFVEQNKILDYYKNIKYILQNSYYESCSNVKVEAFFSNCKIIKNINEENIDYNNLNKIYKYNDDKLIIGNYTLLYNNYNVEKLFIKNTIQTYLINNDKTKEFIFFIDIKDKKDFTIFDLYKNSNFNNIKIGYNSFKYSDNELINMYYYYGKNNIDKTLLGLTLFYDSYLQKRTYNRLLYIFIQSYYCGNNNYNNYLKIINKKLNNKNFYNKNILFLSKLIIGYGGVQKTSLQLIENFDKIGNIILFSNRLNNNNYFEYDQLEDIIPQCLILNISNKDKLISYINTNNFEFIFNNKYESILDFNLDKKMNVLVHNSMDPFNNIILNNKEKIDKLFTINNFHRNLMNFNNYKGQIYLLNNYVFDKKIFNHQKREKLNYKIGYIGRISKEKNIQFLIDTIKEYNKVNNIKIKLVIIGDGKLVLNNIDKNIILTGRLSFQEIQNYFNELDYIISSSYTEGKSFSVIESLMNGIPCINSNINGIDELVIHKKNGYLFDFENYDNFKFDQNFDNLNNIENNKNNLLKVLKEAYSINIDTWNNMSENCIKFTSNKYIKNYCINKNLNILKINKNKKYEKKYKIFVNFKPDPDVPYGGGNISVYYIIQLFYKQYSDFTLTYDLEENIDIYLIIDPFKDNKFKKYSLQDIIDYNKNKSGKIIIRVNDCDKTRIVNDKSRSREYQILNNFSNIDYFIFNSNFIKNYYFNKFKQNKYSLSKIKYSVITNGCDQTIFENYDKSIKDNKKIRIVTHHWSNNVNKGYKTYYDLYKYCKKSKNLEFVFIGKNVPDFFKDVPIDGPFVKEELCDALNDCHIYITDSRYDSCPNHVLEGLSCGLPILYSNIEGGAKELSTMSKYKVGEIYNNFNELINKINNIIDNYDFYRNNIQKSLYYYEINYSIQKYYDVFLSNIFKTNYNYKFKYENNIINIINNDDSYIKINNKTIKLIKGTNVFALNNKNNISLLSKNKLKISNEEFCFNKNKLNNNKLNILLCSDNNYLVGLFAVLHSLIFNTHYLDHCHFNFILPVENENNFTKMLIEFEQKINITLNKTVIYIDEKIIDPIIFKSKCYNGGGHLLNLGNLSRLLIGEFMNYKKLLYLDSDSIVQHDIIEKLINFDLKYDYYSACANKIHSNNKKQIVIKMNAIINTDYDWSKIIDTKINSNDYVYMGAPFLTDCTKWNNVYRYMIRIIKIHNNTEGGIYKLFTMSIQNILFYKKSGNINEILNVIQDCGSARKDWDKEDLLYKDICDWSGIYKPWFNNGLYRGLWLNHDIMDLSKNYGNIHSKKNIIESYNKPTNTIDFKISNLEYLNIKNSVYNKYEKYLNKIVNNPKMKCDYNILCVIDANYLLKKMSRVRFWAIEDLGKRNNVLLTITGPGFNNFDNSKSLQENILNLNTKFDIIMWYKPLNENYNYDKNIKMPFKTLIRYNEMWDIEWTKKEINESKSSVIICHHYNDYLKYIKDYSTDISKEFYYLGHHSHPEVFKPLNKEKNIDILISGVTKQKHYPLKYRLFHLIMKHKNSTLKKYNIHVHNHPGYNNELSFQNINQINYNDIINQSKLCIACTSKYIYRLGKYIEIPMAGSVIVGDIPYEDQDNFRKFVVEVNLQMTEKEILDTIIDHLENPEKIKEKRDYGFKWSSQHITKNYVNNLLEIIKPKNKIFIISDEIRENHPEFKNEKWICDILKQEFNEAFPYQTTLNAKEANIIWYLAPWNHRYIPKGFNVNDWYNHLKNNKVIFTQHHIDEEKLKIGQLDKQFEFMKTYGNKFHGICNFTVQDMKKYFNPKLVSQNVYGLILIIFIKLMINLD